MSLSFEVIKTEESYTFNLVSEKGNTLLLGGEYESQSAIEQAIADVQFGTLVSQQIAAGKTKKGETFFVIKNKDGNIIAKSLLFTDDMLFDNALHTVKDSTCVAEIKLVA